MEETSSINLTMLITYSGWLVGVVSFIITITQIFIAKKEKKKSHKEKEAVKMLLKIAEQHIEKDDKTEELQKLDEKLTEMKHSIQEEIPKEAIKIALRSMIQNEIQVMSDSYNRLVTMKEKLQSVSQEDVTNNAIFKDVYKQIAPTYTQGRMQQTFSNMFIVISVVSSLVSMVLPYEYVRPLLAIVMIIQLSITLQQVRLYLDNNYRLKEKKGLLGFSLLSCSLILLIFSIALLLTLIFSSTSSKLLGLISASIFWLFHFIIAANYFFKHTRYLRFLWLLTVLLTISTCILIRLTSSMYCDLIILFFISVCSELALMIAFFIKQFIVMRQEVTSTNF